MMIQYKPGLKIWYQFIRELDRIQIQQGLKPLQQYNAEVAENYAKKGYAAFNIGQEMSKALMGFFDSECRVEFDGMNRSPSFSSSLYMKGEEVKESLKESLEFFGTPNLQSEQVLQKVLKGLQPYIESAIGGHFSAVSYRAWNTKRCETRTGPLDWHTDGLSELRRKIMIYPLPPNHENGTLEIVKTDGKAIALNFSDEPVAVLLDVGRLRHRGVPPTEIDVRPCIEITLLPALETSIDLHFYGHEADVPFLKERDFTDAAGFFETLHGRSIEAGSMEAVRPRANEKPYVNIGGGRRFQYPDWVNYDEGSREARSTISFSNKTTFPYPDNHAEIVYSSHCLEHLSDDVVAQMLHEAHRILKSDGSFVVKLPDFEAVLSDLAQGKEGGILDPRRWGLVGLFEMWKRNGVAPSLHTVAAMILCGFWNEAYGHEFVGVANAQSSEAYHGPPRIPEDMLKRIFSLYQSPHDIAAALKSEVLRTEISPRFNHRNAWSYAEFVRCAELHGFEHVPCGNVCETFSHIPTIEDMKDISAYYVFRKRPAPH